jgi:hypothetical protein
MKIVNFNPVYILRCKKMRVFTSLQGINAFIRTSGKCNNMPFFFFLVFFFIELNPNTDKYMKFWYMESDKQKYLRPLRNLCKTFSFYIISISYFSYCWMPWHFQVPAIKIMPPCYVILEIYEFVFVHSEFIPPAVSLIALVDIVFLVFLLHLVFLL